MTRRNSYIIQPRKSEKLLLSIAAMALSVILGVLVITACSDSDNDWNEAPRSIQEFTAEYFPGETISDITKEGDVIYVRLKNSAAINFKASDYSWISVNGCGNTVPQQFLFDCLPPALYEFLQANTSLNKVYRVTRDSKNYIVALQNNSISFDVKTGKISYID